MFDVWETTRPARRLGEGSSYDDALDVLDEACLTRHRQAVANGEGATGMRFHFEIREGAAVVAGLSWRPDTDRPYASVAATMRRVQEW